MTLSASDVSDEMIRRLQTVGFEFRDDGPDHQAILDALAQVEFVRKAPDRMNYCVLHVWCDVDPILSDPYPTEEDRDKAALKWRRERDEEDGDDPGGFYALQSTSPIEVDSYSGAFFNDDDEDGDDDEDDEEEEDDE